MDTARQFNESGAQTRDWCNEILTRNPSMEQLLGKAWQIAGSGARVCIVGPSGSGKEVLARAIHRASTRQDKPFVAVHCAAIPEPLVESELFGHVRGAFTSASQDHAGLFLAGDQGTLFLDEIGDMPLALQAKLLQILEEVPVDVRIISATHHALEERVAAGKFREDLYYRLSVVVLEIPPLSERREDIPLLAAHFIRRFADEYSTSARAFSPEALDCLVTAAWPGNVRQLQNIVEQTVALCPTPVIPLALAQEAMRLASTDYASFDIARRTFERDYLIQLLKITEGNVSRAARLAKRHRTDLYKLLRRHEINPGQFKQSDA